MTVKRLTKEMKEIILNEIIQKITLRNNFTCNIMSRVIDQGIKDGWLPQLELKKSKIITPNGFWRDQECYTYMPELYTALQKEMFRRNECNEHGCSQREGVVWFSGQDQPKEWKLRLKFLKNFRKEFAQ